MCVDASARARRFWASRRALSRPADSLGQAIPPRAELGGPHLPCRQRRPVGHVVAGPVSRHGSVVRRVRLIRAECRQRHPGALELGAGAARPGPRATTPRGRRSRAAARPGVRPPPRLAARPRRDSRRLAPPPSHRPPAFASAARPTADARRSATSASRASASAASLAASARRSSIESPAPERDAEIADDRGAVARDRDRPAGRQRRLDRPGRPPGRAATRRVPAAAARRRLTSRRTAASRVPPPGRRERLAEPAFAGVVGHGRPGSSRSATTRAAPLGGERRDGVAGDDVGPGRLGERGLGRGAERRIDRRGPRRDGGRRRVARPARCRASPPPRAVPRGHPAGRGARPAGRSP